MDIVAFVFGAGLVAVMASAATYAALRFSLWYAERKSQRPDWNDGWTPEPEDMPRW